MKLLIPNRTPMDETVVVIECWWNRYATSWVIQSNNRLNYQVGDATYVGHKSDAAHELRTRAKQHPGARLIYPDTIARELRRTANG